MDRKGKREPAFKSSASSRLNNSLWNPSLVPSAAEGKKRWAQENLPSPAGGDKKNCYLSTAELQFLMYEVIC